MTDALVSYAAVQVLTIGAPSARVSVGMLQALTSKSTVRPFLRSVGSSRPILMKLEDGSWWPTHRVGPL